MKYLKLFEDFKVKNITVEDIVNCIQKSGSIYATIVKDFPDNDPENPLKPVSVDEDGLITVEIDGGEYEVDLNDVEKIEESKRSYTKEDHHNLDELVQDIKNIMLDVIDEYQLIDITPSNLEHININDNDIDYELDKNPNSYVIYSEVKHTKHGAYGVVIIRINCKKLYDEQAPSMGKEEGLFKELILRLDTIGHSYVEFEETSMFDLLTIEVTPRN